MLKIIAFVFCFCGALIACPALAFEPVYAPLLPNPETFIGSPSVFPDQQPVATPVAVVLPEVLPPAPPVSVVPQKMTVIDAIERGKNLLSPVLVDFKKKEPQVKPLSSKNGLVAAALAIWDKSADVVVVVGGTRGARYFTPDNGSAPIPIVASSGSQTAYRDSDPNAVVVGTIQADMIAVTVKKKKVYAPSFSYYVPYNSELYSPETLAAGSDYLSFIIKEAFDELDEKNITSRAFPGQPLTTVIDPYLIKAIAVIEHADGQIYEDDNSEASLGRFLVKLALNKADALGDAVSSAGARGMVQFIPSTYKIMVTKRQDLGLIADFVKGMADHNNAIKAEAAYLDMILADLPQEVRDIYIADKGAAAGYIAAGYNGGSVRVKKAIIKWGDDWSVSHGNNASSLRNETVLYVVKLRRVYEMIAAGFFATPNAPANALPSSVAVANRTISPPSLIISGLPPVAVNP